MPLSQTNIANLALAKMGGQPIANIADTNSANAIACNNAWEQAVREVGRSHDWNCIKARDSLDQVAIASTPGSTLPPSPGVWAAGTAYVAGQQVIESGATYAALSDHTSGAVFTTDLNAGLWEQVGAPTPAWWTNANLSPFAPTTSGTLYEWLWAYQLPNDFLLLCELNGNDCISAQTDGDLYELYQDKLFCDFPTADIKYTAYVTDTTKWDAFFTECVAQLLASKIATVLRKDDGNLAARLLMEYHQVILPKARVKNAGERKVRRFDPVAESRWVNSRRFSTNG